MSNEVDSTSSNDKNLENVGNLEADSDEEIDRILSSAQPNKVSKDNNNIEDDFDVNKLSKEDTGKSKFLDRSLVWVRLGKSWWPGLIVALHKCPKDFLNSLRKTPLAVVKFFEENG